MMIAAAVNENNMDAVIPDPFEKSAGIMIFDDESKEDTAPIFVTENFAKELIKNECEVLLCGIIYDSVFFEEIAEWGVTRYNGAGLSVREAIEGMNNRELAIIRDYFGSPGHTHNHHHHHEDDCDGDCEACTLDCGEDQ